MCVFMVLVEVLMILLILVWDFFLYLKSMMVVCMFLGSVVMVLWMVLVCLLSLLVLWGSVLVLIGLGVLLSEVVGWWMRWWVWLWVRLSVI